MSTILRVEQLAKRYRLGVISRRTLYEDLQSRWARWRGNSDPNALIGTPGEADRPDVLWALRDLSFDVAEGDVLAIIGHNGSGKSTLLRILSQITAPTAGRALIKGRVASLLEVGTGFHLELTGRENVFLNGVILGMSHEEVARRFDEIVAFSGIEQFIDTPVKRYSSGMRVRLAFAVAAHLEAEILIIDEVLAVGDQAFQQKCMGKMSEVAHAGRTVLFVSHNAAAVESLCTRGIVLESGRLRFSGSQSEALEYYSASRDAAMTCLRDRQDREGSGELRITGISLRNARGESVTAVSSGEDSAIALHFERRGARDFPRLAVRISVATYLGAPVFSHANWLTGDAFGKLPASGDLLCELPQLPLPPGHYRISFQILDEMGAGHVLDAVAQAAELMVTAGDFFGTGRTLGMRFGVALVPGRWRLAGSSIETP